ncbi:cysteine-rich repeat secretory protein 38-like [Chenopodium quinoa]|uniref:cysteine-rich repeat secretory protein 38-like n=1 Tax=Chenopodium quinoa TaxID=63459 RepID=UPI000B7881B7|nr:cysteine-rich repeat secretory protein 38-like [Chenopodium quinoa]
MRISKVVHYIHILIQFHFISIVISQQNFTAHYCIDTYGNYTSTSIYEANLNTLFSSISSNTQINSRFYNFSIGEEPDQVNGIALCGGDLAFQDCYKCVNDSITMLPRLCPTQKEAIGWYDNCTLRYASRTILGSQEEQPSLMLMSTKKVTNNVNQFNQVLGTLLSRLRNDASKGDSQLKFAIGNDSYGSFGSIYAFAQCSPDLSQRDCFNCIGDYIRGMIPSGSTNNTGAQILGPSCKLRYEDYLFYNDVPSPSSPPTAAPSPPTTVHSPPSGKARSICTR